MRRTPFGHPLRRSGLGDMAEHPRCGPHPHPCACSYVSAMVPVKSPREYYVQQEVIVLFCETVER